MFDRVLNIYLSNTAPTDESTFKVNSKTPDQCTIYI